MNQLMLDHQPLEPEYRTIHLTQGQVATVDAADYEWLNQWKWYAKFNRTSQRFYANRTQHKPKRTIQMHRLIMDEPEGFQVDHRDSNTLNNRQMNLRIATNVQNSRNKSAKRGSRSGVKGVSFHKGKWEARIYVHGKAIRLGHFETPIEAGIAYAKAAEVHHGEFARY